MGAIFIHAPHKRVRLPLRLLAMPCEWFQFTHPTRECDGIFLSTNDTLLIFQSTHPTRECDWQTSGTFYCAGTISIHAPYKRVRPYARTLRCWLTSISIHAPYKRVRFSRRICQKHAAKHFNPRTLQESATTTYNLTKIAIFISIHAPYKRVRPQLQRRLKASCYFNPRTLQESATTCNPTFNPTYQFQSTHPTRECDFTSPLNRQHILNFNPRTLQESATLLLLGSVIVRPISIHAPYKRVRHNSQLNNIIIFWYFNPRTLQESATLAWLLSDMF